jgi:hypothetical protein
MDEVSSSGALMGSPSSDPSFELRPLHLYVLSGLVEMHCVHAFCVGCARE